jgi:hypothetical protein
MKKTSAQCLADQKNGNEKKVKEKKKKKILIFSHLIFSATKQNPVNFEKEIKKKRNQNNQL